MNDTGLKVAAAVVEKSDSTHPADAVLREELRKQRGLSRDDGWEISRAVFSYFRWFGWLDPKVPLSRNLQNALDLAERFREEPRRFPDEELVQKAVPEWIREQVSVTPVMARAFQGEPRLWLRTRRGMRDQVAGRLHNYFIPANACMPDTLEYKGSIDLFRTQEFHDGLFELQDISSQAVGVICGAKPGETWWDACAGEGGKTLHLSELMENKGLIWASDRAEWRLRKLKQRAARAKAFNYRVAPWDGSQRLPTKTKFDGVLIDAPCSGVGTWQRNPHARWTTTIDDVRALAALQQELLAHAVNALKPGGKLIYSVCTITRAETVEVVKSFSADFPRLAPLAIRNPLDPARNPEPQLSFGCDDSGGNGMFVAGWQNPG